MAEDAGILAEVNDNVSKKAPSWEVTLKKCEDLKTIAAWHRGPLWEELVLIVSTKNSAVLTVENLGTKMSLYFQY